ncbi:nucleotidyltransferase domain-containing protein [Galbibacter sp. BG1]|uniref:nucleotidyltransferase domain-containing protein n=1 Tax=Galbibacter sp. BG1 TaxID=1170699 RepID=UPI0015B82C5F|nr:nucleotidyltransferase domain-containing protein [Galbibacter sp. BG1]QLE01225.1 nucleotidyltransferase domain-containing protein [Galbibacter sp. BG1]
MEKIINNFGLKNEVADQLQGLFRAHTEIEEAIIFGSRAMNSYRVNSDVDVALKGKINFNTLLEIEREIDNLMLPNKFDVLVLNSIENANLLDHIEKNGSVFYKKKY